MSNCKTKALFSEIQNLLKYYRDKPHKLEVAHNIGEFLEVVREYGNACRDEIRDEYAQKDTQDSGAASNAAGEE